MDYLSREVGYISYNSAGAILRPYGEVDSHSNGGAGYRCGRCNRCCCEP